MAHVEESGQGRKTSVDVNIVPFIDLMSVLIIFLLITAVWTQVSMIQIGSSIYGKKTDQPVTPPPPRAEVPFRVDITNNGYNIIVGKQRISVPKLGEDFNNERLAEEVKRIKELYPEKIDAVVTMQDDLAYESLINGMDVLLTSGFAEISIATGGAE